MINDDDNCGIDTATTPTINEISIRFHYVRVYKLEMEENN